MKVAFDQREASEFAALSAAIRYMAFLMLNMEPRAKEIQNRISDQARILSRETYPARTASLVVGKDFRKDVHNTILSMFLFSENPKPIVFTTDCSAKGKLTRRCVDENEVRYASCVQALAIAANSFRQLPGTISVCFDLFLDVECFVAEVKNFLLSEGGTMVHFSHRLNVLINRMENIPFDADSGQNPRLCDAATISKNCEFLQNIVAEANADEHNPHLKSLVDRLKDIAKDLPQGCSKDILDAIVNGEKIEIVNVS